MRDDTPSQEIDFSVDKHNLYREEAVTDLKVASIRRLVPVTVDGTADPDRNTKYIGQTQLMSPEGPVPLQAELKAATLEEAIAEFPGAMQRVLGDMVQKLQQMRRQQQTQQRDDSRIIVPGR